MREAAAFSREAPLRGRHERGAVRRLRDEGSTGGWPQGTIDASEEEAS
jgi:hypothetical protein